MVARPSLLQVRGWLDVKAPLTTSLVPPAVVPNMPTQPPTKVTKKKRTPGKILLTMDKKNEQPPNSPEVESEDGLYIEVSSPATPKPRPKLGKSEENTPNVRTPSDKSEKFFDAAPAPTPDRSKLDAQEKCPCDKSDWKSTYVICAKCNQSWHNKCCNLSGLNQIAIKKLETWQCPRCYNCPILYNQPATLFSEMATMKEQMKKLLDRSLSKQCIINISNEVAALKDQMSELVQSSKQNEHEVQAKLSEHLEESLKKASCLSPALNDEISALKAQVVELTEATKNNEVKVNLSPTLDEAIRNVSKLSPDTLSSIETSLSNLNKEMADMKNSLNNQNLANSAAPNQENSPSAPNTRSPNLREVKTPCSPYVKYAESVIATEMREEVMDFVKGSESSFISVGEDSSSREVMYFGEHSYRYTGHTHEAKAMPDILNKILDTLKPILPADIKSEFNSCLVTRYKTGSNHIPSHRDDEPVIDPESAILAVSIGAQRTMSFENNDKSKTEELVLGDRSVLVTSRFAQDFWKHGIPQEDDVGERISLTFRNIAPYYINSTIILGDSNTSRINFGSGAGTLGSWVPGKRVKVGHIEAIPDAEKIGPYRNIVIHTGVNSINNQRYRRTDTYLLHHLESKCKQILDVYPRAKIHISLLLPSRSRQLNHHINEFNRGILDLTYRIRNLMVVDNCIFGDVLSNEHGRWDVNQQQPYLADMLHLGKKGIRTLAMNFKTSILGKSKSQSRSRFDASSGSYRAALGNNIHRDGYQPPR